MENVSFNVFCINGKVQDHFLKINWSVFHKIAIHLLCFWDVFDVNLWEKKFAEIGLIHTEQISLYNLITLRKTVDTAED